MSISKIKKCGCETYNGKKITLCDKHAGYIRLSEDKIIVNKRVYKLSEDSYGKKWVKEHLILDKSVKKNTLTIKKLKELYKEALVFNEKTDHTNYIYVNPDSYLLNLCERCGSNHKTKNCIKSVNNHKKLKKILSNDIKKMRKGKSNFSVWYDEQMENLKENCSGH